MEGEARYWRDALDAAKDDHTYLKTTAAFDDRVAQVLGEPVGKSVDPLTGEAAPAYDAAKDAQASTPMRPAPMRRARRTFT